MKLPLQLRIFISLLFLALLSGCMSSDSKNDIVVLDVEKRPNIILILVDDLDERLGTIQYMPNLKKYLADQGVTVEDFLVTTPMCCPSRVNILRGQYTHNHQIYNNSAPDGGFTKLYATGEEDSTLAVWLQAAGYRTALIGKYLNAYPNPDDRTYIPPGWTEWYSPGRKNAYDGYDYYLNENGTLVPYGPDEENYFTDVMNRKSIDFIERAAKDEIPFFLYIAPFVPHEPAVFARRHEDLLQSIQAPRTPSFNEEDISDKPPAMSANSPLTLEDEAKIDQYYRQRVLSMLAVDEMIADLFKTLEASGELENTYVIFTSDQGFTLGQHRLLRGKSSMYEEDIVVPFIVRGPGIPARGSIEPFLAGMIDIAPTIAEWGGIIPPAFVDGRSFASTLLNGNVPADWRNGFLLQQYVFKRKHIDNFLSSDLLSYSAGIRTLQYTYIEHPDGFIELYDLMQDPYQLENIASTASPSLITELSNWLSQLKDCKSKDCRKVESLGAP